MTITKEIFEAIEEAYYAGYMDGQDDNIEPEATSVALYPIIEKLFNGDCVFDQDELSFPEDEGDPFWDFCEEHNFCSSCPCRYEHDCEEAWVRDHVKSESKKAPRVAKIKTAEELEKAVKEFEERCTGRFCSKECPYYYYSEELDDSCFAAFLAEEVEE